MRSGACSLLEDDVLRSSESGVDCEDAASAPEEEEEDVVSSPDVEVVSGPEDAVVVVVVVLELPVPPTAYCSFLFARSTAFSSS